MVRQIDHLGIATRDRTATATRYRELLDASIAHKEHFDGMAITFLEVGASYLEILEPVDDGPIAKYLEESGPGIHHVAFQVEAIDEALARAQAMDIRCLDNNPRDGAWGHQVAFLHPSDTDGILIEFVQH